MRTSKTWNGYYQIYQGDIVLMRVPDDLEVATIDEISPQDGRLILAEGEFTGHHHAIDVVAPATKGKAKTKAKGVAKFYRAPSATRHLVRQGVLTTDRLAIGFLIITGGPVMLRHEEHDALQIDPGTYYIGAQREMDSSEERRIKD